MRARTCAVALFIACLAAVAPGAAGAKSRVVNGDPASTPAVQAANEEAKLALGDVAVAAGRTKFQDFALAGFNADGGASQSGSGAFAFAFRQLDVRLVGEITCIKANGNTAALGGRITASSGGAELGDAVKPGSELEITVEHGPGDAPDRTSALFLLGAGTPADCSTPHALRDIVSPGFVSVFDR